MVSINKIQIGKIQKILLFLCFILSISLPIINFYFYQYRIVYKYDQRTLDIAHKISANIADLIKHKQQDAKDLIESEKTIPQILQNDNYDNIFFINKKNKIESKNPYKNLDNLLLKLHEVSDYTLSNVSSDNASLSLEEAPSLFISIPYFNQAKQHEGTLIFQCSNEKIIQEIEAVEKNNYKVKISKKTPNNIVSLFPKPANMPFFYKKINSSNIIKKINNQFLITNHSYIISTKWNVLIEKNITHLLSVIDLATTLCYNSLILILILLLLITIFNRSGFHIFTTINKNFLIILTLILSTITFISLSYISKQYKILQEANFNKNKNERSIQTHRIITLIQNQLLNTEATMYDLQIDLANNDSDEQIKELISNVLIKHPFVSFVEIFHNGKEYANRNRKETTIKEATKENYANKIWYQELLKKNQWSQPIYKNNEINIRYSEPISDSDGFISIGVSIDKIKNSIFLKRTNNKNVGSLIYTKSGHVIHHSQHRNINYEFSIKDILYEKIFNEDLQKIIDTQKNNVSGFIDKPNNIIFFEPITAADWVLISSYDKKNLNPFIKESFHLILIIILLISLLVFFLALYFSLIHISEIIIIQEISIAYSIILVFLAILILILSHDYVIENSSVRMSALQAEFSRLIEEEIKKNKKPFQIPTGIYVESIEVDAKNQFSVNVWQKLNPKQIDAAGVTINNAIENKTKITEQYKKEDNGHQNVGWKITGELIPTNKEIFNYPFDNKMIQFILKPTKDINALFVVDTEAYQTLEPEAKSGINPKMIIDNFIIEKSFFSYSEHQSNTGLIENKGKKQLTFNILLKRNLMNSFLLYFLPLLVLLLTIFFAIRRKTDTSPEGEKKSVYGQSSLLFALIFIHQHLRNSVQSTGLSYMEILILFGYLIILFPYVEILFPITKKTTVQLKLILFWSLISTVFFIVTFGSFYI